MNKLSPTQKKRLEDMLSFAAELERDNVSMAEKNAFLKSYIDIQPIFPQLRHLHNVPQIDNIVRQSQAKQCQPQRNYNSGCSSCGTGGSYTTPSAANNCYSQQVIENAIREQQRLLPLIADTIKLLYDGKIKSNIISV